MSHINRREFLKAIGLAGTSATVGCSSDSARKLIPYILPAEDIIPGEATWYATTCRECPAGCGMLAKNRDGRIIKVEGNPNHPVNNGALCARGQASLHDLYNPDRFTQPFKKFEQTFEPISWAEGMETLSAKLKEINQKGRNERIIFLSGLINGSMKRLTDGWLEMVGEGRHIIYEPFGYESLRTANKIVFGNETIPYYRIAEADLIISFGAGFLETWLSNVDYAKQFAKFHAIRKDSKNLFVFIGSRRSMTAANADIQLIVPPEEEWLVAGALLEILYKKINEISLSIDPQLRAILDKNFQSSRFFNSINTSRIDPEVLKNLANLFLRAKRPLVLAAGMTHSTPESTAIAVVTNLLCLMKKNSRDLIDFNSDSALSQTATGTQMKELSDELGQGEIDLLLLYNTNPAFSLPSSLKFLKNLKQVEMVVSFNGCPDESTNLSHLVLPTHTSLESWGDYSPRTGITGLMQPVMGPLFNTKHLGDILLETGKRFSDQSQPYPGDFYAFLRTTWEKRWQSSQSLLPFDSYWQEAIQRGGEWHDIPSNRPLPILATDFQFSFPEPEKKLQKANTFSLVIYPTIQFFDGRMANRPWLQELPDPITQVTWGGWVEMHPETAAKLHVNKGDVVKISSGDGNIEAPVLPIETLLPGVIAIPIGQGHLNFGRYADGRPVNPFSLFPATGTPGSEGTTRSLLVQLNKTNRKSPLANTDGSFIEEGRDLVQTESVDLYKKSVAAGNTPDIDIPLPKGFDPRKDFYPPHTHKNYRWCMVVDLDRCIGCGACVVACYAENNVAFVGRKQVLLGREMSWLRIQRYFTKDGSVRFLPMLCQHCDAAPCESVCPIFAPHHSEDGLNNQVYNRCFGTRFCSQNDPYKVRRFNWFTFTRPTPLNWQLNPDVTVRQKGVMEKCSFCVQRIVAAKFTARRENRKVRDDEFTTACAQTCPVDALIFGNLKDKESRVFRLINDSRAYQVLHHLNTKPAVIYLKKLTQEL